MSSILVNDVPSCRIGTVGLDPAFRLSSGGSLSLPRIGYSRIGPADAPAVLVMGGISAGRDVCSSVASGTAGWWEGFVGSRCPVDTRQFRVLGLDYLGGAGASGGPVWPGSKGSGAIPPVTPGDQAAAIVSLLDVLGIERLHACIGSSYGGMVALELAASFPERVERLVVISGAHRPHPMATAIRSLQRGIVLEGVRRGDPRSGLRRARALAMTTYRSAEEFDRRFTWRPASGGSPVRFPVQEYLDARGDAFARRFTPETFLCLSLSIDLQDVDPGRVRVPVTLVSVDRDTLVRVWQMQELERGLGGPCVHHTLSSIYGHDAFLKERESLGLLVTGALRGKEAA